MGTLIYRLSSRNEMVVGPVIKQQDALNYRISQMKDPVGIFFVYKYSSFPFTMVALCSIISANAILCVTTIMAMFIS